MRIAEIAPVWDPVPPPSHGGIPRVAGLLADGLAERGHDVTLFAPPGSNSKARIVSPVDVADGDAELTDEILHALPAYQASDEYDVIHDHTGMGIALPAARPGLPPVVHTLHGPWTAAKRRFLAAVSPPVHLIAISEAQAADNPDLSYAGVVHNGIDPDAFPWKEDKEDFLVVLGRCVPDKGIHVAVEVAKRAGLPLVMMVRRSEPHEIEYWEKEVAPRLAGTEEVMLEVGHDEKTDILARARATLMPMQWPEPFGLVLIESMACGTPVIATPRGAAPEVVVDGQTGIFAEDIDEMVTAVGRAAEISPSACRNRVVENFSLEAMVTKTETVLERLVRDD